MSIHPYNRVLNEAATLEQRFELSQQLWIVGQKSSLRFNYVLHILFDENFHKNEGQPGGGVFGPWAEACYPGLSAGAAEMRRRSGGVIAVLIEHNRIKFRDDGLDDGMPGTTALRTLADAGGKKDNAYLLELYDHAMLLAGEQRCTDDHVKRALADMKGAGETPLSRSVSLVGMVTPTATPEETPAEEEPETAESTAVGVLEPEIDEEPEETTSEFEGLIRKRHVVLKALVAALPLEREDILRGPLVDDTSTAPDLARYVVHAAGELRDGLDRYRRIVKGETIPNPFELAAELTADELVTIGDIRIALREAGAQGITDKELAERFEIEIWRTLWLLSRMPDTMLKSGSTGIWQLEQS